MIQMEFYYNSFNKRDNSTRQPTGGGVYDIVFKDEFSILGGTVKLRTPFFMAKKFVAARYDIHYYKVVDVVSITNDIVEVTLELDVLASYKDNIARYTSLIERSPSKDNIANIVDNTIAPLATNTRKYVAANVYPPSGLTSVCFQIKTKNGNGDLAYFLNSEGFSNLLDKFEAAFWTDETQYIISTKVVPIPASSSGGTSVSKVYIGNQPYNITSGACYVIKSQNYLPLGNNSVNMSEFLIKYSDERKYNNNYVRLQCKLNGDIIDLDANYIRYTSFITESYIDPVTLDVRLEVKVKANSHDYLIASTHTNIGIGFMFTDVPNSLDMIVTAMSTMTKSYVTKGIDKLPEGGKAIRQLGPNERVSDTIKRRGIRKSIDSIYAGAAVAALAAGYQAGMSVSTAGAPSGSAIAATMYGEITFYVTVYDSTDANPNELGYPYMKRTSIEKVGLNGYYKFVAPQISLTAMPSIKEAINEYLANGIFYE